MIFINRKKTRFNLEFSIKNSVILGAFVLFAIGALYQNRSSVYVFIAESPLAPIWDWYRAEVRGQKYENISLPKAAIKELEKNGISIRRVYKGPTIDNPSPIRHYQVNTPSLQKYPYEQYFVEIAAFLNQEETLDFIRKRRAKMILDLTQNKHLTRDYWIMKYKAAFGYNDAISPAFKLVKSTAIRNNRYNQKIEEIAFKGRFQSTLRVFRGIPKTRKGILIALHGGLSSPELIFGLSKTLDYGRDFAAYWLKKGFIVYAPQVLWNTTVNMERIGFSPWGSDAANVIDLIKYIKLEHGSDLPLIISGISNGGITAEAVAIISKDVDGVILNGSNGRIDFSWHYDAKLYPLCAADPYRKAPKFCNDARQFGYDYYNLFNALGIIAMIAPKPLVLSNGTEDLNQQLANNPLGALQFQLDGLKLYKKLGVPNNIKLNVFYGIHEADPEGEYNAMMSILGNQESSNFSKSANKYGFPGSNVN